MKKLRIGQTILEVKDYECSQNENYIPKAELRLWLYVNLTTSCNAACPFCVNAANPSGSAFDITKFSRTLVQIAPHISGISLTGGEPMLDLSILEETISVIKDNIDSEIELDMVTNGTNLECLPNLHGLDRFATIHISRHAVDDEHNRRLMGWKDAPSATDIASVFHALPDPGCTVLNCVLQKGGIHDLRTTSDYLEMAADICASNVSFIGMFQANSFCKEQYISPATLGFEKDGRYNIWNRFHDHHFCQCLTGDYRARNRYIRFYYRCPGPVIMPLYCRQLVYGADNVLRQGFGDAEPIEVWS